MAKELYLFILYTSSSMNQSNVKMFPTVTDPCSGSIMAVQENNNMIKEQDTSKKSTT